MFVKRNKASITTIPVDGVNITLYPGMNTIEGEAADKLREHKDFKAQVAAGYMEEVQGKKVESPVEGQTTDQETTDITEMGAGDAIEVVKETLHVKHLENMLADEKGNKNRKSVKKAIEAQMAELRESGDGDGDE